MYLRKKYATTLRENMFLISVMCKFKFSSEFKNRKNYTYIWQKGIGKNNIYTCM